jgi:osmotically-inducible protein OsmY
MQEGGHMPGNYRYEEERNRGQRGMTRRGEFGGRGREDDEYQEQQTERFGRGPDYERDRGQGERTWGSSRRQYGYDEGFRSGSSGRSLGGRDAYEGYDEEEGMGAQGGRYNRGSSQDYEQGAYGQGYGQYGQGAQGGFGQGQYGQGSQYDQGGFGQGGRSQTGYGQGGGFGQGRYSGGQSGQPRSQYGQSGYGSGQGAGGSRGGESSRYGQGMNQADGWNAEPDEMRWGRQQGLYGSSEYGGYISSQRAQSDYQSHVGKGPKNWQRSDERIREEVNEALARHPEIDASEIEVKVQGGEVTLTGTVTERRAKRQAEDVVERVFGVSEVQNQIRVKSGQDTSSRDKSGDRELSRSTEREGRTSTEQQGSQRTTGTGPSAGTTTR